MTELRVESLSLRVGTRSLLRDVHLQMDANQRCALLGPSGSGKTLLLRALMGLTPPGAQLSGRLDWDGRRLDLRDAGTARAGLGLIFQGAGQALHPLRSIGDLLAETARAHRLGDPRELLASVGLTPVERYWQRRPDQLSGGQRQRALIALTLAANPRLLLADEPTAALDSVARAEILALLQRLCSERGLGLLLVAHDPTLVRQICTRATVLVGGEVVEAGELRRLYEQPAHPWTGALVTAQQRLSASAPKASTQALDCVKVEALGRRVRNGWRGPAQTLLEDIEFGIRRAERVALMGASGSGKSTLGRCLVGLDRPTAGAIHWPGATVPRNRAQRAATVQMVLQDSRAALNPMHRIATSLDEARRVQRGRGGIMAIEQVCALTEVDTAWLARRPSALSGGQCQRVALARALIAQPQLLILDESLSALDPPLRVDLIEQLEALSERLGFALLLITHDFSESRRLCSRTLVLDHGRLVEQGATVDLAQAAQHSATRALVAAWRGWQRA